MRLIIVAAIAAPPAQHQRFAAADGGEGDFGLKHKSGAFIVQLGDDFRFQRACIGTGGQGEGGGEAVAAIEGVDRYR